jgi:ABC-type bacteriocin/lantibiotic exporter with double-glycine peptidase domain
MKRNYYDGKCGCRSFFEVMKYYNGERRLNEYYRLDKLCDKEMSMYEIENIARTFGIDAKIEKLDISKLREGNLLGVLHVDGHHFVGLVGYDSQTIHIAETGYEGPPRIERWSDGDLMARWDGVILVISNPKDANILPVAAQKGLPEITAAR